MEMKRVVMINNHMVPSLPENNGGQGSMPLQSTASAHVAAPQRLQDIVEISSAPPEKRSSRMRINRDVLHEQMEAIHVGTDVAQAFQVCGIAAGMAGAGTIASGVYFGIEGLKDLRTAFRDKDLMGGMESVGHLALGGEVLLHSAHFATHTALVSNMVGPLGTSIVDSAAFIGMVKGFGLIHGGAEVVVGGKEVMEGAKQHDKKMMLSGALNVGIGASILAIAMGGGMVGGIALGALFLSKMILTKPKFFGFPLSRIPESAP